MGVGTIDFRTARPFEPIAPASKLEARLEYPVGGHLFVTVRGPCGEGHTMSFAEAQQLAEWLLAKTAGDHHQGDAEV